ncbi:hypothetical protein [Planococcus alpniumensis]|uniref:hypothetical protein n=1 Tax=Planococcus alpniumensis TaxID=2708345 RepID=UPI001B8AB8C1|nr:hypothetical protein [Planococcus sp. MSAK28401]
MTEQIISHADLNYIENSLNSLDQNIGHLTSQVDAVNMDLYEVHNNLNQLIQEFQDYVQRDLLGKNLQLAETRIVKVRQELESEFGHYGEVRRRVSGILQAVDVGLVKKEKIENSTEEHMLASPRYWLAPALIALAAWLNDNKELADKAMKEAMRRDNEKTALFFALVTRRGARYQASSQWVSHYFGLQNPEELEREIVIMIDGFTNGVFGPDARVKCAHQVEAWVSELAEKEGFVEEQNAQWEEALISKMQDLPSDDYPYLQKYSSTWGQMSGSMQGAQLHRIIHDYFADIFNQEVTPSKTVAFAVDEMLDKLVTKFDEEELPLRKEERLLSLIIQQNGDEQQARNLFNNEKSLEERVSFTQLLTNFAMHPETSNASLATQKFSIAWSKDWIKNAHDDITAKVRSLVPMDITLQIEGWQGVTQDGGNETELVNSLSAHIEKRKNEHLSKMKFEKNHYIAMGLAAVLVYGGFNMPFLFLIALVCGGYIYMGYKGIQKKKEKIAEDFQAYFENCKGILRASLAEVADWRQEYAAEDAHAPTVSELLDSINPEQYAFSSHDNGRAIIS